MTNSNYSRSPKLLKGALISFSSPLLIPIPNLIIFQYNPETISRSLSPWAPKEPAAADGNENKAAPSMVQPNDPEESLSLNLEVDATDALEEPESHPVAVISGVADRLAAMEMLLYPPDDGGGMFGLNISISASVGGSGFGGSAGGGAAAEAVPRKSVPIVLFFWGPGRIVPVRLTSFFVEEQAFSPLLYPLRAKVAIGMKILDEEALDKEEKTSSEPMVVKIAKATYKFTRTQKQGLALANLANSVESIMGMLPF
jgi:hypothetical protein